MRNRKVAAFFNRKSYIAAAVIVLVAAFGMTGIYYSQQEKKQEAKLEEEQEAQVQQAKAEDEAKEKAAKVKAEAEAKAKAEAEAKAKAEAEAMARAEEEEKEETEAVSGIIDPEAEDDFMDEPEVVAETNAVVEPELHFDAAADLNWPLEGTANVILNYSMDRGVYFASLREYKYNPAIVISSDVNTPVKAAAAGKVTEITTNEETGTCITVDMGDGYSVRYGQLKEIPKNQGDYVESGETIGYISEPTKYYSEEGANLYFQLLKDGAPIDPMEYLE